MTEQPFDFDYQRRGKVRRGVNQEKTYDLEEIATTAQSQHKTAGHEGGTWLLCTTEACEAWQKKFDETPSRAERKRGKRR